MKQHQIKILMLMYQLEQALGEVYSVFKERFPEYRGLWDTLIEEEHGHAEAVRDLYKLTYEGQVAFDEGSIKPDGVQSVIDYVKGVADSARRGKYTSKQALSLSYNMEKSLLEKDFFRHFRVSSQFTPLLRDLMEGAKRHLEMVKNEADKLKR